MSVFDPVRYHEDSPPKTLAEVFGRVIDGLADRDNVSIWTSGQVPATTPVSLDASAHFDSFHNTFVEAAAAVSCDGEGRFAAADLASALSRPRVFHYLGQINPESTDADLLRFAQAYVDGALASEVRRRHTRPMIP